MVCGVSVNKKFVGSNVGIEKRSRSIEKRSRSIEKRSRSNKKRSRSYREASLYIERNLKNRSSKLKISYQIYTLYIERNLKNRSSKLKISYQIYTIQGEILLGFKEILIGWPKKFLTRQMHVVIGGLRKIVDLSFSLSSTDMSSEVIKIG